MNEMSIYFLGCVVFLLASATFILVLLDVVLVDFDKLSVPFFWVNIIDDREYFRAELFIESLLMF
jgi:hypothetical protein